MMHVAQKDGRIITPIVLEIDLNVIFIISTRFAIKNAAKNGVFADTSLNTFKQVKFDLFKKGYFDLNEDEKSYYQAEILVLQHIPSESITNLKDFQ